jgi:hypothetical protein
VVKYSLRHTEAAGRCITEMTLPMMGTALFLTANPDEEPVFIGAANSALIASLRSRVIRHLAHAFHQYEDRPKEAD